MVSFDSARSTAVRCWARRASAARNPPRKGVPRFRIRVLFAIGTALRCQTAVDAHRCAQPSSRSACDGIEREAASLDGSIFARATGLSQRQPASGKIKHDRKCGRMCSLRGRSAPFARLGRAKRLVAEFAWPVSRSATAHSTVFSVICGVGRIPSKDQPAPWRRIGQGQNRGEILRRKANRSRVRFDEKPVRPASNENQSRLVRTGPGFHTGIRHLRRRSSIGASALSRRPQPAVEALGAGCRRHIVGMPPHIVRRPSPVRRRTIPIELASMLACG